MGTDDGGAQPGRVEPELDVDLVAGGTEAVETALGDLFGDEDACHAPSMIAVGGHLDTAS